MRSKRSERARKGAIATNKIKAAKREPRYFPPDNLFRVTVENLITGKQTVITMHPGTRSNNLRIEVDGQHWKTCGMVAASKLIINSLFSAASPPLR
mgnify:CR=1 FL=1